LRFKTNKDTYPGGLPWNDILKEWYELNNRDPWPKVISALETCEHYSTENVMKAIKEKHLYLL